MEAAGDRKRFVGGGAVRLLWVGPLAGLVAAALNVVVFLGASAVGVISQNIVVSGRGPITIRAVTSVSFVPALLGRGFLRSLGCTFGVPSGPLRSWPRRYLRYRSSHANPSRGIGGHGPASDAPGGSGNHCLPARHARHQRTPE